MAKKRVKAVSFDAMVKFFMLTYDIPSRKDLQRIMAKLESLETMIKNYGIKSGRLSVTGNKPVVTAFETVLQVIKSYEQGAGFDEIQEKTGFNEKKIRNIIFRLNKLGKIKRKNRGTYIAV